MTLNARAPCPVPSPSWRPLVRHLVTTWAPLGDVEVLISVKKHTYTFTDMTWRSLPAPLPLLPDDPWRGIVGGFGSVRHVASFEKALSFKLPFAWICQKLKIKSLVGLQWCSFLPLTNCTQPNQTALSPFSISHLRNLTAKQDWLCGTQILFGQQAKLIILARKPHALGWKTWR